MLLTGRSLVQVLETVPLPCADKTDYIYPPKTLLDGSLVRELHLRSNYSIMACLVTCEGHSSLDH